jgi:hypothetical protein
MRARAKISILAGALFISAMGVAHAQSSSWNGQGIPPGAVVSSNSAQCAQSVQSQIAQQEQQYIAGAAANAANTFPYLPGAGSMIQNSCLSNLIGGNLSLFFEPPNLMGLLDQLVNKACSMASNVESQAIAPITQGLQQGLPSYEIAPGVTTGALEGGLYVNPNVGGGLQQSGPPVSVNITPMFNGGGQNTNQSYFNGLIGVQ